MGSFKSLSIISWSQVSSLTGSLQICSENWYAERIRNQLTMAIFRALSGKIWFLALAILAIRQASSADFDWDIAPLDGYPTIAFGNETNNNGNEITFKYSYTGNLSESKYMTSTLLEKYCNGTSDGSLIKIQRNDTSPNQLEVDVDIMEETIRTSKHYTENADATQATISFCLRIDYNYNDGGTEESINFHETSVTILVDLTANFTLAEINTGRTDATQMNETAQLDYPVTAYFCKDNYDEAGFPTLTQGSLLQFCVKIDESVDDPVFVADILEISLSQPGGNAAPSRPISNTINDPLTQKTCSELGICNVKHQLTSKWFMDPFPEPLQVDGVALLSFGIASSMPSAAPSSSRRELRAVPIRVHLHHEEIQRIMNRHDAVSSLGRTLQGSTRTASDFELKVSLLPGVDNSEDAGTKSFTTFFIVGGCTAALAVLVCLLACRYCCCKKSKKAVEARNVQIKSSASKKSKTAASASDASIDASHHSAAAASFYASYYPEGATTHIDGAYPEPGPALYQPNDDLEIMMSSSSAQLQPYLEQQQQSYIQQPSPEDFFMMEDFGFVPSGMESLSYNGGGGGGAGGYEADDDASSMWSFGQRDSNRAPDFVFQGSLVD
jgi:hypothetical protein